MSGDGMKLLAGTANVALARRVANALDLPLSEVWLSRYPDGEIEVRIDESVRGADCFILQPTCTPSADNLMEMLILIDALRRASAARITTVIPYFGYARQDRKVKAREPITARLIANVIERAGADRVLCIDLHTGQLGGFFNLPVDHLTARDILGDYFRRKGLENVVVVSPDIGGSKRAREFAQVIGAPLAVIDKRRDKPNQVSEVVHVIGKVYRRTAIVVDDMVDTAGTLVTAAHTLLKRGVTSVYACCTHPVLSGPAVQRLSTSPFEEVVVTDTIPIPSAKWFDKLRVLTVAPLLAQASQRIHTNSSVSELYDQPVTAELIGPPIGVGSPRERKPASVEP
ncbi:MAG: ribose-phosphate pyrophosphokinase [Armatimonadetes bacterium]|nr:ribose-phosphate pyrophosphokinase [Armatimonadota bacterium]